MEMRKKNLPSRGGERQKTHWKWGGKDTGVKQSGKQKFFERKEGTGWSKRHNHKRKTNRLCAQKNGPERRGVVLAPKRKGGNETLGRRGCPTKKNKQKGKKGKEEMSKTSRTKREKGEEEENQRDRKKRGETIACVGVGGYTKGGKNHKPLAFLKRKKKKGGRPYKNKKVPQTRDHPLLPSEGKKVETEMERKH